MRAWDAIDAQELFAFVQTIHADSRPAFSAVVAVGGILAWGQSTRNGYCDLTLQQIHQRLKGAYGESVIRNALHALRCFGTVAQVKGGTLSKDGTGRGAWHVFVNADTKGLIPEGYTAPSPRKVPDRSNLSQSVQESATGSSQSATGSAPLPDRSDLSPLKDSLNTPTAASAQPLESVSQDDVPSTAQPTPTCGVCAAADPERSQGEIDLVVRAVISRGIPKGMTWETAKNRAKAAAVILSAHRCDLNPTELADVIHTWVPVALGHGSRKHDALLAHADENHTRKETQQ